VPEDAKLALLGVAAAERCDRLVDANELMVLGDDLDAFLEVEDEILDIVKEPLFEERQI
jgi:hypothetical protein